ncbi:MAG: chemotaxis protein CheX [Patescibacteria group bacterium]|nr:chemotaxis protein CheX [Patescibacteria group bacterium]
MDVKLVNPFLEATLNVLSTMAFTKAVADKPYLKQGKEAIGDITGIISFSGDATGSLSITFTQSCIVSIVSNMLGETITEINEEVRDAVGELTNMISGDARRKLQQHGYSIRAAIPTVISGKNHVIKHFYEGPCVALPFKTESGDLFIVEINVKTDSTS